MFDYYKRRFLPKFSELQTFSRKGELCKKWNLKAVDGIKDVLKIWLNPSEKRSIVDVRLGSKYETVSITLHLTFLKRT